jgi:zinc and cadmium transporter
MLALSVNLKQLKKIVLYMVSFSAGGLFGDAFLHLLPKTIEEAGFGLAISSYVLFGISFSFVVEKIIHWRHCHLTPSKDHVHPFAVMNLFGDAVHNFIDGVIIATSYLVSIPVGIATTLAVILHEIPQEIGDFAVLIHGNFSKYKALLFNFMTALTAVAGALAALLLSTYIEGITVFLLPFAAGNFIYIAGADLIPELHKEVKIEKSIMQLLFFGLGVLIMVGLLFLDA